MSDRTSMRGGLYSIVLVISLFGCATGPSSQKKGSADAAKVYAGAFPEAAPESLPAKGGAPGVETSASRNELNEETNPGFGIALLIYSAIGLILLACLIVLLRRRWRLRRV